MLTGSGQFGPKATVSHYRTLKGVRNTHLSFQKIVLKTFGEWTEGKVRLNIVEQGFSKPSEAFAKVHERTDRDQCSSTDGGWSGNTGLMDVGSLGPITLCPVVK